MVSFVLFVCFKVQIFTHIPLDFVGGTEVTVKDMDRSNSTKPPQNMTQLDLANNHGENVPSAWLFTCMEHESNIFFCTGLCNKSSV